MLNNAELTIYHLANSIHSMALSDLLKIDKLTVLVSKVDSDIHHQI